MSMKLILFCIVLLVIEHETVGLTCYQCSAGSDGCSSSFHSDGSGVVKLSQSSTGYSCTKTVSSSNGNAISRGMDSTCTSPVTVPASNGVDGSVTYCCDTDLCNQSSLNSSNILLTMAISIFMSLAFILN